MTGRKADASAIPSLEPHLRPKSSKRPSSTEDPHEGHDEVENEYTDNNEGPRMGSWNVFDQVRTLLSRSSTVDYVFGATIFLNSWAHP